MDEQVALMEKSYELAAKYMGGQNEGQPSAEQRAKPTTVQKGKKNKAMPIRQVEPQVVSSLSQPMSNAEFVAALSQERNRGFMSKKAYTRFTTIRKKLTGAISGSAILKKRRIGPAPSMAAASINERGMDCSAA